MQAGAGAAALDYGRRGRADLLGAGCAGAGHGFTLGMFLSDTGAFVGVVALRIPARNPGLEEGERAEAEGLGILGYSVLPERWGQGYAGEGAERLVRYAFEELGLSALQASLRAGNVASARVLRRLGFTLIHAGLEEEPLAGGPPHLVDRYMLRGNPA